MDRTALVTNDIEEGKRLLLDLDQKTSLEIEAALWFYISDSGEWRLLLASKAVEKKGPKEVYSIIQSVLQKTAPNSTISLSNISVISSNDHLIRLLRRAITTGKDIAGIRFTRNRIDNTLIEDAYIYRLL